MNASAAALSFLVSIAIKATMLVVLAAVLDHGIMRRRASASARHLLWSITLGAALVLPLAGLLIPTLDVPLPDALSRVATSSLLERRLEIDARVPQSPKPNGVAERDASVQQGNVTHGPTRATPSSSTFAEASPARDLSTADIILVVYLAGVLLLLGRVAAEQRVVRRLERSATPLRDVEWHALYYSVAESLGVRRRVAMLHGAANTMPLTWGVKHPAVLIPATAADWPESRRRAVLLHELAHVARHDCLTQTLAAITCALYWPHPGIWWAAHRLRIERELACDDQALLAGIGAHDYAGHLLEIAHLHRVPAGLRTLAVSMAARSHLEARLLAAIDGARRRAAPSRGLRAAGIAIAALLLFPLAALHGETATAGTAAPKTAARARAARPDLRRPIATITSMRDSLVALRMSGDVATAGALSIATPAPPPAAQPAADTSNAAPHSAESSTPLDGRWIIAPWRGAVIKLDLEWSDDTPWRRALPIAELHGVTAEQIAASKASTVTFSIDQDAGRFMFEGLVGSGQGTGQFRFVPNREFVTVLRSLGVRELGNVTDHQLKNLAFGGMSAAALRGFDSLGLGPLTKSDITEMAIRMVNPDYVRDLRAAGVTETLSVKDWIEVSFSGVTAQYVREMAELGYDKLSTRELTELWRAGVTPAFMRALRSLGERPPSKEELIQRVKEAKSRAGNAP